MINEKKIRAILEENNIEVDNNRGGKNLYCHCPFHEDKKASLVIRREDGYWCCFSDKCITYNNIYRPFEELIMQLNKRNLRK